MKKMKKLFGLLLAMVMVFSLSGMAFASETQPLASSDDTTGTIRIYDAEVGETYSIYEIFELTYSDDSTSTSYSYQVLDAWKEFIGSYTYVNGSGDTVYLFDLDDEGYLKSDSNVFDEQDNSEVMAAFAQAALAYATTAGISPTSSLTPSNVPLGYISFSGLRLGYYLVSTSLGSLCMLDSTNPQADINEKNPTPYPEKEEYDDETDEGYTKEDTAEVGDTIEYEVFLHDVAHSVKLCMHDTMSEGLTFTTGSVKVYVGYPDASVTDLFNDDTTEWTEVSTVYWAENDSCGDGCTFELSFTDEWLDTLSSGAVIRVTYEAVVNEDAIDENNLWAIQHNDVVLTYGNNGTSTHSETDTDTVGFIILKYTDTETNVLDGAEFSMYRDADHTDIVYFVPIYENGTLAGYEEVDPSTYTGSGTPTTTITAGYVYVKGLHEGTYYLTETKAPEGYNLLTSDVTVNVTLTEVSDGVYTETVTVDGTEATDQTAKIENKTGSILPGTGGRGTTIFYVIGAIVVAGAVIILVTRRRLNRAA